MLDRFFVGKPVDKPEFFIGRQQDFNWLASRMHGPAFESTELIGERRIGKTSILHMLAHADKAADYGLDLASNYLGLYLDMGLARTPQVFWANVLEELEAVLLVQQPDRPLLPIIQRELQSDPATIDGQSLRRVMRVAAREDLKIFLMCDEFEKVACNPAFDVTFYGEMRALLNSSHLAMITSSRYPLTEFYTSQEILGSPFFNVFLRYTMPGFTLESQQDFIATYSDLCEHQFSPEEAQVIDWLGGRFPFYMQLAGSLIIRYLTLPDTDPSNLAAMRNWIAREFLHAASPRFQEMWDGLDQPHQQVLYQLQTGQLDLDRRQVEAAYESPLHNLIRRGLIIERSRRYEVFSRAFARWIQDQPDPVPHANPHHAARQSRSSRAAAQVNDDEAKETPESFVFISYTRHDGEFALELAEYLKQNQIRVWIDQIDIPSGVPWDLYIEDAIRDATVLLPILTTESIGSINVRNEIHYAIKAGKLVLPLVYRPCPIPLMLQAIHYLDYHQDAEKALSELLERLQAYPKLRPGGE